MPVLMLLIECLSQSADPYGFGSGRDGSRTATVPGVIVNAYARLSADALAGSSTLQVTGQRGYSGFTGFAAGDLVMVLVVATKLGVSDATSAPLDLSTHSLGNFELARLSSVTAVNASSQTLIAERALSATYEGDVSQVILVREYTDLTVNASCSLSALNWDGQTGGVLAVLVSNQLKGNGQLSAANAGYRGGLASVDQQHTLGCDALDSPSPLAGRKGENAAVFRYSEARSGYGALWNGGGGGNCRDAGGGGGGLGGAGGKGGITSANDTCDATFPCLPPQTTLAPGRDRGGRGGSQLIASARTRLLFGGGGGAGSGDDWPSLPSARTGGGNGGGIVFVRAATLVQGVSIVAAGGSGCNAVSSPSCSDAASLNDGGSGGGSGGTLHVRFGSVTGPCPTVVAAGGAGGSSLGPGAGGGGSGGRVFYQRPSACPANTAGGAGANAGSLGEVDTLLSGARAPSTPLIDSPASSGLLVSRSPTFIGRAEASTKIVLFRDGLAIAETTSASNGTFSLSDPQVLRLGPYHYELMSEALELRSLPATMDVTVAECTESTACAMQRTGSVCLMSGQCGCNTESDCTVAAPVCRQQVCTVCLSDSDCPAAAPRCDQRGRCVSCSASVDCAAAAPFCNAQSLCSECLVRSHCSNHAHGNACVQGACGCVVNTDCPLGSSCGGDALCVAKCSPEHCPPQHVCEDSGACEPQREADLSPVEPPKSGCRSTGDSLFSLYIAAWFLYRRRRLLPLLLLGTSACVDGGRSLGNYTPQDDRPAGLVWSEQKCSVIASGAGVEIQVSVDLGATLTVERLDPSGARAVLFRGAIEAQTPLAIVTPALPTGSHEVRVWTEGVNLKTEVLSRRFEVVSVVRPTASDLDTDGDCYTPQLGDCRDDINAIHPGATEVCQDGLDNDCDQLIDYSDEQCGSACVDFDGDGSTDLRCGGLDCFDRDPLIHPLATELCDGVDNDCDGLIDEDFDDDGDTYARCAEDRFLVRRTNGLSCSSFCDDCDDGDTSVTLECF